MRPISIIILLASIFSITFAQKNENNSHPLSKSFAITGEGGVNIGGTDFPDTKIDYFGRGSIEYFLSTSSPSVLGFKIFAGGGFIAGKGLSSSDTRYSGISEFQTKIVYGGAGLVYSYSFGKVLQPYLSAGLSYLIFNPLQTNGSKMPRNQLADYAKEDIDYMAEFGMRFLISNRMSFNIGYTYNYIDNDNLDDIYSSENDMFHSLFAGFTYYFVSSRDTDGDGINDKNDLCEDTPVGVTVDEFGCPQDNDSDGVPDYKDLCPGTPTGVEVDTAGCPLDTDMDGIADYLDKCPNTEPGTEVDSLGCKKIVELKLMKEKRKEIVDDEEKFLVLSGTANFNIGESKLLPNPKAGLEKILEYMKKNPKLNWIIEGHTDNIGNEVNNFQLSLERAKSVLNYFVVNGIDEGRFDVLAAGSTKPVADNSIEFGRALNRRVIIEEKESYQSKMEMMTPVESVKYDEENEYNIESLIFTDGSYYCIQVSSWKSRNKAEAIFKDLVMKGHPVYIFESFNKQENETWYRVRIGYFDNLEGARKYLNIIR